MTSWMNSTGHSENILSEDYTEIGIAAALARYEIIAQWTWRHVERR